MSQKADKALKKAGLKATGPRRKILALFEGHDQRHLTAEDVYRELTASREQVSLATVYRVLAQFETAGLLVRHHLEDAAGKSVFELARLGDHNHLICVQCGMMQCFTDEAIDRRQREIAERHGFALRDYSLYTYVNCTTEDCPNKRPGRATETSVPAPPQIVAEAGSLAEPSERVEREADR